MSSNPPKVYIKINNPNDSLLLSAKKMELENKRKNYEELIPKLLHFVLRILNNDRINELSYEVIYTLCYKICIEQGASDLNDELTKILEAHVRKLYTESILYNSLDQSCFFRKMVEAYNEFISKVTIILKTFLYFENSYLVKKNLLKIKETSRSMFYSTFYTDKIIKDMQNFISESIFRDREGRCLDTVLVGEIVDMTDDVRLNAYEEIIEKEVLPKTSEYYKNDYTVNVDVKTYFEYSVYLKERIAQEEQRIAELKLNKSKSKIINNLCCQTVQPLLNDDDKIHSHFLKLLKINDAYHMHIFKQISSHTLLDKFYERFCAAIEAIGKETVLNEIKCMEKDETPTNKPDEIHINLTTEILSLIDKIEAMKLLFDCLNSRAHAQMIFNAIYSFINNQKEYKMLIPKMLARYIDTIFKQHFKFKTLNTNIEADVKRIFNLFKFIKDRDIFEINHRKLLSYRILNNFYFEEMELNFLSKLKLESGAIYTHRCEVMINDMKNSSAMMNAYQQSKFYYRNIKKFANPATIDISFRMLTTANWIINLNENISNKDFTKVLDEANPLLAEVVLKYSEFFKTTQKNKIMNYNLFLGNCEVRAKLGQRNYLVNMSPFQALVCLKFNKTKKIKLSHIFDLFQIKDKYSMLNSVYNLIRAKILLCNSEEKLSALATDDKINNPIKCKEIELSLNSKFIHKQLRIIINQNKTFKEKVQKEPTEPVILERKYVIESNIIRIMKSKQTATHNELYNEVVASVINIFTPDSHSFKQRIESLIERNYIQRVEDSYNTYIYIA